MRIQLRLVMAAAAMAAFIQLHAALAQTRAPLPAAGGDAVTAWNADAGVAATKACIAPPRRPIP